MSNATREEMTFCSNCVLIIAQKATGSICYMEQWSWKGGDISVDVTCDWQIYEISLSHDAQNNARKMNYPKSFVVWYILWIAINPQNCGFFWANFMMKYYYINKKLIGTFWQRLRINWLWRTGLGPEVYKLRVFSNF